MPGDSDEEVDMVVALAEELDGADNDSGVISFSDTAAGADDDDSEDDVDDADADEDEEDSSSSSDDVHVVIGDGDDYQDFTDQPLELADSVGADEGFNAGGVLNSSDEEESAYSEDSDDEQLCIQYRFGFHGMMGKRKTMEDTVVAFMEGPKLVDAADVDAEDASSVSLLDPVGFFAVYDGHGGDAAAVYLAEHLHRNVYDGRDMRTLAHEELEGAVLEGCRKTESDFIELAAAELIDAGSTAVVAMCVGRKVVIANVGECLCVSLFSLAFVLVS